MEPLRCVVVRAAVQSTVYVMWAHLAWHNKFQLFSLTPAAARKMLQLNNVIMCGFNSGNALVLKLERKNNEKHLSN